MENKIVDILKVKDSITRRFFTKNISKLHNIKEITLIKNHSVEKNKESNKHEYYCRVDSFRKSNIVSKQG